MAAGKAGRTLPRDFYDRDTLVVAKELLGKVLVRRIGGQRLSGRIVETEGYLGPTDVASHAQRGPESKAAPMFGEPGHAYVYFTYGMHYCMNVVTEPAGSGTAVLLRALEPLDGLDEMQERRGPKIDELNLTNGPAKLCQAFGIGKSDNTVDLTGDALWLEDGPAPKQIETSARVGISRGRDAQYRFYDADSQSVSAHPKY